jgi:hypothetical protein
MNQFSIGLNFPRLFRTTYLFESEELVEGGGGTHLLHLASFPLHNAVLEKAFNQNVQYEGRLNSHSDVLNDDLGAQV